MKIISIHKAGGIVDHDGKAHAPFTLVDVSEGHALTAVQRSSWVHTEGDFERLLDTAAEKSVRQMCKNAGLPADGDRKALKARLVEFANAAPGEKPQPEAELVEEAVEEAEVEAKPEGDAGAEAELREELELKNIQELKDMCADLGLKKSLPKAELIDQIVEAMR